MEAQRENKIHQALATQAVLVSRINSLLAFVFSRDLLTVRKI